MSEELITSVRQITYRSKERLDLFRELTLPQKSVVLASLSSYVQQDLIKKLTVEEVTAVLDHMDLPSAKKIVKQIKNVQLRDKIINCLKTEIKEKIEHFLLFHPKATMALVNFYYVSISGEETIGAVANIIEDHYLETGKFPEILVHKNGVLQGEIKFSSLVRERNSAKVKTFVKPVVTISYRTKVEEVIETFVESENKKIIVLDEDESVLGIIYADDALSLFDKLPAESLYDVAGLDQTEKPFDLVWEKFTNRNKWLVLNLLTAFLAGFVILLFENTIDKLAVLAVYIPIVTGMGGNAANQTFAVMMRGITLGTVHYKDGWLALKREVGAGLLNGLLIGGIVALVSLAVNGSIWLGLVVALAMLFVHLVAGFFGAFVPLFIQKLGNDPATVSMIFITTATDVFGMLSLLGLGALILF